MIKTPEFEDFMRIFTPEGERIVPLSQVKAILRKAPSPGAGDGQRTFHHFRTPPAVGVELRSGAIIWSEGETDWYLSGEPSRVGR